MSQTDPASTSIPQFLRSLFHLAAVIMVTVWGFIAWPLPWPGILIGVGVLVLAVLLWALFLSPRPVLRTDRFAQAVFEVLLLAAAVAAMLSIGVFWLWPVLFGVAGVVLGYVVSSRQVS